MSKDQIDGGVGKTPLAEELTPWEKFQNKTFLYVVTGAVSLIAAVGIYGRVWETYQPMKIVRDAVVDSVEPYSENRGGDLHWHYSGVRARVNGDSTAIDFSKRKWDETVQEGDTVDLVVRDSFRFPGQEKQLDGMAIDDYESWESFK